MSWLTDEISRVTSPRLQMMEQACRYVMALGYEPSDCLIQHHQPNAHVIDGVSVERDVLLVNGVRVFEVTATRRSDLDACRIDFTYEPRVLTWPAPKDAPAAASATMVGIPR